MAHRYVVDTHALIWFLQADTRVVVVPLGWEILVASTQLSQIPEMHDRLIVSTARWLQMQGYS